MQNHKISVRDSGRRLKKRQILVPLVIIGMNFTGLRLGSHDREQHQEESYFQSDPIQEGYTESDIALLSDHISRYNPGLSEKDRQKLARLILEQSTRLAIPDSMIIDGKRVNPVHYLTAMIQVESSYIKDAVSTSDARGYMQVKPMTADYLDHLNGEKNSRNRLFHGPTNIKLGVDYINRLTMDMPDMRRVTLAYNAGPNAVKRGSYKPEYWKRVLHTYRELETRARHMKDTTLLASSN